MVKFGPVPFKNRFIGEWISNSLCWDQDLGEIKIGNGNCNITTNNVFWDDITENIVNKGSWMTYSISISTK